MVHNFQSSQNDFDFVRRYARFGGKKDFVPFLWCNWQHQDIDLYVGKLESRKKGIFYFGTVVLPGIVYLIPLNRCDDTYAIGEMKHCMKVGGNSLNICDKECFIKRDPIELRTILSSSKEKDRLGNKGHAN